DLHCTSVSPIELPFRNARILEKSAIVSLLQNRSLVQRVHQRTDREPLRSSISRGNRGPRRRSGLAAGERVDVSRMGVTGDADRTFTLFLDQAVLWVIGGKPSCGSNTITREIFGLRAN